VDTPTATRPIFNDIDDAIRGMCAAPSPPAVDGRLIGLDAPARRIPLQELHRLLLDGSVSYATRDRALAIVADRAREQADPWILALTWLLRPGLRRMRDRLLHAGADAWAVEAELVGGVASWLHDRPRPAVQGVAASICWHAYRHARRGLGLDDAPVMSVEWAKTPPVVPPASVSASAESVLNAAVEKGVLTWTDAEVVAATRLDCRSLDEVAAEMGVRPDTLQRRRARAEARLTAWLDGSAWKVIPRGGRLGLRWARALAQSERERRAAASYRARPGGRVEGRRNAAGVPVGAPRGELAA